MPKKGKKMRAYQEEAVKKVLESNKNTLLVAPTGSGKTFMAKKIASALKQTVVFVVPRIDLIHQAAAEFNYDCDYIWRENSLNGKHIIVASRQTLQARADSIKTAIPKNAVYIFDEVHIGLPFTKELMDKLPHSRVIGLTASPERTDGRAFVDNGEETLDDSVTNKETRYDSAIFDEVVEAASILELQNAGYLAKLEYSLVKTDSFKAALKKKWQRAMNETSNAVGGEELTWSQIKDVVQDPDIMTQVASYVEAHLKYGPCLVFTPTVKSAREMTEVLNSTYNFNFIEMDGSMKDTERQKIYEEVKNGKYTGIVNCALLTYGFDMPEAGSIVLCRKIKSRQLYVQTIGRVLRPKSDGRPAYVLDTLHSIECTEEDTSKKLLAMTFWKRPVSWRWNGYWLHTKEEDSTFNEESLQIAETDEEKSAFIEDPVKFLLAKLYSYAADWEMKVTEADKGSYEVAKKTETAINVLKDKEKDLNAQLQRMELLSGQVTNGSIDEASRKQILCEEWLNKNGFEWQRHHIPQTFEYCVLQNDLGKEKLTQEGVLAAIVNKLPEVVLTNFSESVILPKMVEYCRYWAPRIAKTSWESLNNNN